MTSLLLRQVGAPSGQCATVQRVLQDDRIVARVDSFCKEDGVKGEVIIDIQPANVVYTTFPHYARDTKLLLLHEKKLVDASVLNWVGAFEYDEGSRHMISIKPRECKTGSQVWYDLNRSRPRRMVGGLVLASALHDAPSTSHRYDLNQFNHVAVPTEVTSFTFEEDRVKYCKFVTAHEDKVEDAITGNLLLIKDQLIFLALADIPGGTAPPQYQVMKDVPELSREQVR